MGAHRFVRRFILVGAVALGCSTTSARFQQTVEDAETGRPGAWHTLCHVYTYGGETSIDYEKAREWCTRSSEEAGDPSSKAVLGDLYFRGNGGERDLTRARSLYEEAAEIGEPHGMYMLGLMYKEGLGVERDPQAGEAWLLKARKNGYSPRSLGRRRTLTPTDLAMAAPCRYQGTYHRELRNEIERRRMKNEISEEAWLCQARALEAMDLELRSSCAEGASAAQPVLEARVMAFEECKVLHPTTVGGATE